ncbi:DUF441 domain-containing protein [Marinicrinis lubricantis]|uniref:UPF0756 membrane protein ACFPXP_03415 n=1 Tax=Marinicrinis lubricantis TaxID=2086470 RepID=A0ABW1IKA6_9BACL
MAGIDIPALTLLLLAALGIVSKNATVTIAMVVLLLLRLLHADKAFPFLEKHGITIGVIILTIGVMSPIASGRITFQDMAKSFTNIQSLLAIGIGIFVAYMGSRGVSLMSANPLIVTGILIGTILGVALFKGVPVGPLIAAGLLSLLIGKQ